MARKSASKSIKKPETDESNLDRRVGKFCAQGDVKKAARLIADANPREAQFDELMASHPGLRDAFSRL